MTIRHATDDDRATLRTLWERWQSESVAPPWADTSWEANEPEFDRALDANGLFLAEENGEAVGFVVLLARGPRRQDRRPRTSTEAARRRARGGRSSRP